MFKNALVSVSNKEGLVDFLSPMANQGLRIVSTGGTAKTLKDAGLDVIDVSSQTGFPEVMGGRVKTLHPKVHMALLSREGVTEDQNVLQEYAIEAFDLVIGNLYPFEETKKKTQELNDLIEKIDIGGPSFLRAAAKNFERITVICDPLDYRSISEKTEIDLETRRNLAAKVFSHCSSYDSMIAKTLVPEPSIDFNLGGKLVSELRYGENPQQKGLWYRQLGESGLHDAEVLQGKALSYNNLLDLNAAIATLREFVEPTCIALKHNNPCGVASRKNIELAVQSALEADPVSVFGGIIAVNRTITKTSAQHLNNIFLECIIAPDFDLDALEVFKVKKNLRVMKWPEMLNSNQKEHIKTIDGGFLYQTADNLTTWDSAWEVIGSEPSQKIKNDLVFAQQVCARLKSNAIAICQDLQSRGLGMGQVNRVDAVEQAISRAIQFHKTVNSSVLASDAFFPFRDSIEKIAKAGIRWVIQPGGSVRDDEVKQAANQFEVGMILTGKRHFLH